MARKKVAKKQHVVLHADKDSRSLGKRNTTNQKTLNAMRKETGETIRSLLDRNRTRNRIIWSPQNAAEAKLKDRFQEQNRVELEVCKLLNHYGKCGMVRATAVQAIKTNYVDKLNEKWGPKLKAWLKKQEKLTIMERRVHIV